MLLIVLWNCNFLLVKEIRIRDILPDWLLNSFWSCVVLLANLLVMLRDPVSVKLHIIGLMISHWLWKLWHTEFMVNSIIARFPGPVGGKLITLPPPCLTVGMRRLCSYAFVLWPNRSTRSKGYVPDVLWFSWQSFQTMHNSLFFFHLYLC